MINKSNKKVRVRYAPSPTGHLHIGGARTALFNYLFAKHNNGKFIVRIEDTDLKRNIKNGEKPQLDNLKWLGIIPDESTEKPNNKYAPYRQTERLEIYKKYEKELLDNGYAYKCYCTSEELEKEKSKQIAKGIKSYRYSGKCIDVEDQDKPHSIRLKLPKNKDYEWEDLVRGKISVNTNDIGDFVIIKNNGIPTYNFAVVVDDISMEISHVLRGEEHISNTPKQLAIYEMLNAIPPLFGHMTLITNEDGKKLSKRDETIMQFISQYKKSGYIPEAMFNFMSLLGWSPEGEKEIFNSSELIKIFDYKRLSKSSSTFDKNKLIWINNKYMKNMDNDSYIKLVASFMKESYGRVDNDIALLFKNQISFAEELINLSSLFYNKDFSIKEDAKEFLNSNDYSDIQKSLVDEFEKIEKLDVENISIAIKSIGNNTGKKGKDLFMPIRIFITGQMHGPDLKNTIKILGKEKVLKNLKG